MDFMQTMPAFVFMIPVIAFFGTGKVAAVIITMIFGGTPVVRLTVLGLRGVPETIREAAIAYGATNWKELEKQSLDETINALAMASPFSLEEKQVLLEAENLKMRKNKIAEILSTYTYDVFNNTTLQ